MSESNSQTFARKLAMIRQHLGFNLDQMAEAIGRKDKSRRARIHEWESGIRQPDYKSLLAYARLVDVSTDTLIDDSITLQLPSAETGDLD